MSDWTTYLNRIRSTYWYRAAEPIWTDAVPSMMSGAERNMLWHLTRDFPDPIARIIDAGCFGGASTVAFCKGLLESGQPLRDDAIVSYDLFRLPGGKAFLAEFTKAIGEHERLVSVVKGDICDFGWTGGPISILFLDLLKMPEINEHCLPTFLPSLIPGRSIVIQQDFIHPPLPWIPLSMDVLSDYFEPLAACRSSVVFRCIDAPSAETVRDRLARLHAMSVSEKTAVFNRIIASYSHPNQRAILELSKIWMMVKHPDFDAARAALAAYPDEYRLQAWVAKMLADVEAALAKKQAA